MKRKETGVSAQWLAPAAIALAMMLGSGRPARAQAVSLRRSRAAELRRVRQLLVGAVTFYVPGRIIEVTSARQGSVSFRLDGREGSATVDSSVGVETKVEVEVRSDALGRRRITIRRYDPPGTR